MREITERQVERIDALFVQSAVALTSGLGSVTLHGLTTSTIYFADRPRREVGHIASERFVALWDEGFNSFAIDPPNAVLSFLDDDEDAPEDAVVVLSEPSLDGDALTYRIQVLEGTLPKKAGPCALFIDVFGRPLSPVSVASTRTWSGPARRASRRASAGGSGPAPASSAHRFPGDRP